MSNRVEDLKTLFERQKESFVELLRQELVNGKLDIESKIRKSLDKDISKNTKEVESLHDQIKRVTNQARESAESIDRKSEDNYRSIQLRIDTLQELIK